MWLDGFASGQPEFENQIKTMMAVPPSTDTVPTTEQKRVAQICGRGTAAWLQWLDGSIHGKTEFERQMKLLL
jgi:hypothetical protein